jgi:hypothetical protein
VRLKHRAYPCFPTVLMSGNGVCRVSSGIPLRVNYAYQKRNGFIIITRKKLFITRNYVLRIIASFVNEMKRNVITRNFRLNETDETTIQRVFSTFKSLFSTRVSSGIPLHVNYA